MLMMVVIGNIRGVVRMILVIVHLRRRRGIIMIIVVLIRYHIVVITNHTITVTPETHAAICTKNQYNATKSSKHHSKANVTK